MAYQWSQQDGAGGRRSAPASNNKGWRQGKSTGRSSKQVPQSSAEEYDVTEYEEWQQWWNSEQANWSQDNFDGSSWSEMPSWSKYEEDPGNAKDTTHRCWKVLAKTVWVDNTRSSSGTQKSYYLYWDKGALWVQVDYGNTFMLPSIEGGLGWGSGRRNAPPKFTLNWEEVSNDKMVWRKSDGSISNVWLLQENGVDKYDYDVCQKEEYWSKEPADWSEEPAAARRPGRSSSKARRAPRGKQQYSEKEEDLEKHGAVATDERYRYLAGSTWVEAKSRATFGGPKKYELRWEHGSLVVLAKKDSIPLPSIEGGLRWGAPGRRNAAPKYTLADDDIEEHRLTWRSDGGSISHQWLSEESQNEAAWQDVNV